MSPKEFIELYIKWSGEQVDEIAIKKNEYLCKSGQIEKYLYLITNGAFRVVYISKKEEFTVRLGYKDSVISLLDSFITGIPSQFYLEAIRKSKVIRIEKSNYLEFISSDPKFSLFHTHILNDLIVSMFNREIDLLTSSSLERYQRILKRSPKIFQEIPLKYIASYLRMTPETLSRLRKY